MNLTLNCQISLSKKLRKLLGEHGTVTLTTSDLVNGIGEGRLSFNSEYLNGMSKFDSTILGGETNITLTPTSAGEEVPTGLTHGTIFSSLPSVGQEEPLVQRLAAVHAPSAGQEHVAINRAPMAIPSQYPQSEHLAKPACQSFISDLQGLIEVVNLAKNKVSSISLEGITDPRQLAILTEEKEKQESIGVSAYIVNTECATLSLNDLGISLSLNMPYDLSNISARRIASSKDLKQMIQAKFIKFISPAEAPAYIAKATGEAERMDMGLEVFSDHEAAQASIESGASGGRTVLIDDATAMDVSADGPSTTEEQRLINLTQISSVKETPAGTRVSVHGSSEPAMAPIVHKPSQTVPQIRRKA